MDRKIHSGTQQDQACSSSMENEARRSGRDSERDEEGREGVGEGGRERERSEGGEQASGENKKEENNMVQTDKQNHHRQKHLKQTNLLQYVPFNPKFRLPNPKQDLPPQPSEYRYPLYNKSPNSPKHTITLTKNPTIELAPKKDKNDKPHFFTQKIVKQSCKTTQNHYSSHKKYRKDVKDIGHRYKGIELSVRKVYEGERIKQKMKRYKMRKEKRKQAVLERMGCGFVIQVTNIDFDQLLPEQLNGPKPESNKLKKTQSLSSQRKNNHQQNDLDQPKNLLEQAKQQISPPKSQIFSTIKRRDSSIYSEEQSQNEHSDMNSEKAIDDLVSLHYSDYIEDSVAEQIEHEEEKEEKLGQRDQEEEEMEVEEREEERSESNIVSQFQHTYNNNQAHIMQKDSQIQAANPFQSSQDPPKLPSFLLFLNKDLNSNLQEQPIESQQLEKGPIVQEEDKRQKEQPKENEKYQQEQKMEEEAEVVNISDQEDGNKSIELVPQSNRGSAQQTFKQRVLSNSQRSDFYEMGEDEEIEQIPVDDYMKSVRTVNEEIKGLKLSRFFSKSLRSSRHFNVFRQMQFDNKRKDPSVFSIRYQPQPIGNTYQQMRANIDEKFLTYTEMNRGYLPTLIKILQMVTCDDVKYVYVLFWDPKQQMIERYVQMKYFLIFYSSALESYQTTPKDEEKQITVTISSLT